MSLRLLVVEGNTASARETHRLSYGQTPSESYAEVLRSLASGARVDIACPADAGFNLPEGMELAGYDGVALTGSSLHLWHREPAVDRQVELARLIYASRTPFFGSCWGIQIATVAAGGDVQKNPLGREVGFARNIAPTEAGRVHPLLRGRRAAYDAPAIHLDAVTTLPGDITVLAQNAMTPVQAAEIRHGGGTFWGVQYHPEFSIRHVAVILERNLSMLINDGFVADEESGIALLADWFALDMEPARQDIAWKYGLGHDITDDDQRLTEIQNWLEWQVQPVKSARGRA